MARPVRWSTIHGAAVLALALPVGASASSQRPGVVSDVGARAATGVRTVVAVPAAPDTTPPKAVEETPESFRSGAGSAEVGASREESVPGNGPLRSAQVLGMLAPSASSVMEAAWGAEGEPAVLHVLSAGVEPEPVPGLRFRVELLAKWGHDGVPFPSSQGLSSLDADDFGGLGEAWVEWQPSALLRLKAGRVDGNGEFAAAESAAPFANPSFGLSPALGLLPSYPDPAPSINLFVRPGRNGAELGAGVYRAVDGSWSAVGQVTSPARALPVRWAVGVAAPVGQGAIATGHRTAGYLIVEGGSTRDVRLFGKVAAAGELLHLAGGLTAPLPVAETRVGLAGSMVSDSGHPFGEEVVAEAFIAVRPASWLVIQPDLQVRLSPGTSPRTGALLRVIVER